ncbi:ATP synthase F1 subunit delta [Blattabacterium cuenoti]|uniref:ATP synthase F1 subunit delta n=1 Tax=Blattabacterium cuenoti TaxID=1653831 RepID=UPI00163B7A2A|nr:ATP synthase F1 subunit delta [Blattabacterium cuenoti]
MFLKKKITKHYARVFFEYSVKNKKQDFIFYKIKKISFLLYHHVDFQKFLNNPFISKKKKILILEKIFHSFDFFLFHFIKLIVIQKRESFLGDIFLEYQKIYKENKGYLRCILTSSSPLNTDFQKMIVQKIISSNEEFDNKNKYHIINKIDPSVIGGFLLRVGYKEWDFSVKKQLFDIQKMFKN